MGPSKSDGPFFPTDNGERDEKEQNRLLFYLWGGAVTLVRVLSLPEKRKFGIVVTDSPGGMVSPILVSTVGICSDRRSGWLRKAVEECSERVWDGLVLSGGGETILSICGRKSVDRGGNSVGGRGNSVWSRCGGSVFRRQGEGELLTGTCRPSFSFICSLPGSFGGCKSGRNVFYKCWPCVWEFICWGLYFTRFWGCPG